MASYYIVSSTAKQGEGSSAVSSSFHTRESKQVKSTPHDRSPEAVGAHALPQIKIGDFKEERPTEGEIVEEKPRRPASRRVERATHQLKRLLRWSREEGKKTAPTVDDIPNILDTMGSVDGPGGVGALGLGAQTGPSVPAPPGRQSIPFARMQRTNVAPGYEGLAPFMNDTQGTEEAPKW
ncbi:unnamed protein product [Haemonchus placei]|uniref:BHLH domain-containing protein n=1 Tax=Haemonchus placei TaxID=6290 RepID=A0A0N4WFE0_HAEPC|nr:unnamed protein product [Haemonchus placei]